MFLIVYFHFISELLKHSTILKKDKILFSLLQPVYWCKNIRIMNHIQFSGCYKTTVTSKPRKKIYI